MKERYFLFFALILFCFSFVLADAVYYEEDSSVVFDTDTNYLAVTKLRYEPYPVSPGDYFTIWVQVEKSGSLRSDAVFELIEEYPFSLDDNEDSVREIFSMSSEAVVLEYQVRVSEDAVSGYNVLKFRQSLAGGSDIISEFDVYVDDVQTSFDAVVQDNTDGELSIALANIGQNDADAAIVRVPEQDGVMVSGTNGQMIGNLEQGDYTVVGFTAATRESSIVLQIDYTDRIGERRFEYIEVPLSSSYDSVLLNASNPFGGKNGLKGDLESESSVSLAGWVVAVFVLIVGIYLGRRYYLGRKFSRKGKGKAETPSWVSKGKAS